MRRSIQELLTEYGPVALGIYLAIFLVVLGVAWGAIHFGWRPESATGNVGALAGAYIVTKASQPFRIAGTLLLTPVVARVLGVARKEPAAVTVADAREE